MNPRRVQVGALSVIDLGPVTPVTGRAIDSHTAKECAQQRGAQSARGAGTTSAPPQAGDSLSGPTGITTRYRTIVADPPWDIGQRGSYSWREGCPSGAVRPLDYPTMTLEDIAALPVDDLASHTAHLFLWTTQRHLGAALDIIKAWEFRYVCDLIWCKAPHGWGPGGIFQSTVEHCIYATRGQHRRGARDQIDRQWWVWPRGVHSAKPEAFLDMVETHFPDPRLEMFARRQRLGWDTWGDEALQHIEVSA